MAAEDFENAMQARFQVERPGEGLARIEQAGKAADFSCRRVDRLGRSSGSAHLGEPKFRQ
jgi:hypothetical protein